MKSFIYTLSPRSRAGNVTATIFRVKRNQPELLGTTSWNTAAYAGDRPEVRRFLMANKHIPHGNVYHFDNAYYLEQV